MVSSVRAGGGWSSAVERAAPPTRLPLCSRPHTQSRQPATRRNPFSSSACWVSACLEHTTQPPLSSPLKPPCSRVALRATWVACSSTSAAVQHQHQQPSQHTKQHTKHQQAKQAPSAHAHTHTHSSKISSSHDGLGGDLLQNPGHPMARLGRRPDARGQRRLLSRSLNLRAPPLHPPP